MPRWVWFLPVGGLVLLSAIIGFRLGWLDVHLDESTAIEAYAKRYMRDSGAPAADCTGIPGQEVWLVVRCGAGWEYHVNRFGGLKHVFRPGEHGDRLQRSTGRPRT